MRRAGAAFVITSMLACGREAPDIGPNDASEPTEVSITDATIIDASTIDASVDAPAITPFVPCTTCDASTVVIGANAAAIAVDESTVYWSTSAQQGWYTISKCAIGACTPETLIAHGQRNIVLEGSNLFAWWIIVVGCATDCSDGGTILNATIPGVQGFAASGASAFWSAGHGFDLQASVMECDPGSCDAGVAFAANQPAPRDIAADDASVYWINFGGAVDGGLDWVDYADGGIMTCAIGACDGGVELAAHQTYASSLVTNTTTVFWIEGTSILACAKSGCGGSPKVLATFAQVVSDLAVDDATVYFVLHDPPSETTPWRVVRLALDGSSPPTAITVDQKSGGYCNLALNTHDVFWCSPAGDIVMTAK